MDNPWQQDPDCERHRRCDVCTGRIRFFPSGSVSFDRMGTSIPAHATQRFDLREPRRPGWWVHVYLHGRRDETKVQVVRLKLDGRNRIGIGEPDMTRVIAATAPWHLTPTRILGVCGGRGPPKDAPGWSDSYLTYPGFEPDVLAVNKRLIYAFGRSGSCTVTLLPIVHIMIPQTELQD